MNCRIVLEIPTTQKHKMTIYYQSKESYRHLMNSRFATENLKCPWKLTTKWTLHLRIVCTHEEAITILVAKSMGRQQISHMYGGHNFCILYIGEWWYMGWGQRTKNRAKWVLRKIWLERCNGVNVNSIGARFEHCFCAWKWPFKYLITYSSI